MIIPTDAEKAFKKIQLPFTIKTLNKLGTEGTYLNIKGQTCQAHANIILRGEELFLYD